MALVVDYKLDKVIKEIQSEMKAEMGIDLEYRAIEAMVQQQVNTTVAGMGRGDTVVWKFFGNFSANQRRVDKLNERYQKIGKRPTLVNVDSGFYQVKLSK